MRNLCLTAYRISLTLWLGAALFFATVAIKPMRSPDIEAIVRPRLALILFPEYYHWGFGLLGIALIAGVLSKSHLQWTTRRFWVSMLCTTIGLLCMIADRLWIYAPLENMMRATLTTQVPAADFRPYHVASWTINGVMLTFCLVAAVLACWATEGPAAHPSPFQGEVR